GCCEHLAVRDDSIHEPHLLRPRRLNPVAKEQELHRRTEADNLRRADCPDNRGYAELDFAPLEHRPIRRDPEVAGKSEREAGAEAMAVDRGDRRLPELDARQSDILTSLPEMTPRSLG